MQETSQRSKQSVYSGGQLWSQAFRGGGMKKSFRNPEKAGSFHLRKPLNNAELKSKAKKKNSLWSTPRPYPIDISLPCVDNNLVLLYCFLIKQTLRESRFWRASFKKKQEWRGEKHSSIVMFCHFSFEIHSLVNAFNFNIQSAKAFPFSF